MDRNGPIWDFVRSVGRRSAVRKLIQFGRRCSICVCMYERPRTQRVSTTVSDSPLLLLRRSPLLRLIPTRLTLHPCARGWRAANIDLTTVSPRRWFVRTTRRLWPVAANLRPLCFVLVWWNAIRERSIREERCRDVIFRLRITSRLCVNSVSTRSSSQDKLRVWISEYRNS